jgi:hypothetical protein
MTFTSAPPPNLRIVPTVCLFPHEDHDSQRSEPLIRRISAEKYMINPPIVAPMNGDDYVILDGANRVFAFSALEYPHILVQVASYDSGYVQLETWHHLVGGWTKADFIEHVRQLPDIHLVQGHDPLAIAHITLKEGQILSLRAPAETVFQRNAALRQFVSVYQRNAALYRTALDLPEDNWALHPDAIAMIVFPHYKPADIIAAAKQRAFLPAGVSRHIVFGRAIRVNYPIDWLRDPYTSIEVKNETLLSWIQEKMTKRQVRFYAEATFQFDE